MKLPYAIDRDHYRKAQAIACRAMEPSAMDTSTNLPQARLGDTEGGHGKTVRARGSQFSKTAFPSNVSAITMKSYQD